MTRLYLVRHGETDWNKQNRTQGCSNDLSLNDEGRKQAHLLSLRLSKIPIDVIYSSDLKRAVETAEEISKIKSLPVNKLRGLREMRFGCWEGMTFNEISEKYKEVYEIWSSRAKDAIIPDAETIVQLQERVLHTVNDIIKLNEGKNILLVSHGISIKILILSILGVDISFHSKLSLNNSSLSIVDYKSNGPVLKLFNDTCHLLGGN